MIHSLFRGTEAHIPFQPFTHGFPRADIHELLSPDLLHQLIKGVFKDHLITWVNTYIIKINGKKEGEAIIQDIDRRYNAFYLFYFISYFMNSISGVPSFPGLRRFTDGWDFHQWTGDDSKALMKV